MSDSVHRQRLGLGRRAEGLAAAHLEALGYAIVSRNWRRPEGELDVVAIKGDLCVFVEVRSRTGVDRGHPLETIDARKRGRVRRAALMYIDAEHPPAALFRFDVVAVTFGPNDDILEVVHLEDAFS